MSDGFGTRFGMVYVDFKTQKRMPTLSAAPGTGKRPRATQWFRWRTRSVLQVRFWH